MGSAGQVFNSAWVGLKQRLAISRQTDLEYGTVSEHSSLKVMDSTQEHLVAMVPHVNRLLYRQRL